MHIQLFHHHSSHKQAFKKDSERVVHSNSGHSESDERAAEAHAKHQRPTPGDATESTDIAKGH